MLEKIRRKRIVLVAITIIALVIAFILSGNSESKGPHTEYQCDVKSISFSTEIHIDKEGEDFAKVTGNVLRFVIDPLTMYDLEGKKIAYADDTFHFLSQDSHTINVDGAVTAEMVGLINFFGDTYDIYNPAEEVIAEATFNMFNTKGEMYDKEGNIIADFNSKLFFNDFTVRIYDNCKLDDNTVLMIFCSYYSDQKADISGGAKSTNKNSK